MKRFRMLDVVVILFVLGIMIASGLLTSLFAMLLIRLNLISPAFYLPVVLPVSAITVSIILGAMISFAVSKRIIRHISNLMDAMKQVAKGDFSIRVDESGTKHELRQLLESFNAMTEELSGIEFFRNDFINSFSHELKTPIVSIRGFARQLQTGDLTPAQRIEYTDIIVRESERLTHMSAKILLLTKFENQQIVTEKKDYSLDEQLRNCILLLEKEWVKKDIHFELLLNPVIWHGNEEMLSHVWINLLANAIKFSQEGGEILVRCRERADGVEVKIADKGIGMDGAVIKHIFEKFYQADDAHAADGNGLGLSLVKRIIALCCGHITVESEAEKGTTFYVLLPSGNGNKPQAY